MNVRATVRHTGGPALRDVAKLIQDKMLLDLHAGLVLRTPVDTGQLRAGWTVDTDAGKIENNVTYVIEVMENGHSRQTPPGTITSEIDRVTRL